MKRLFLLVPIFALVFSCSSDDDSSPQPIEPNNFYALTVGNEWVYKWYFRSTQVNEFEFNGVVDSVSIVGTEEINGNTYFKVRQFTSGNNSANVGFPLWDDGESYTYLRDSVGYLVEDNGTIYFNNSNHEPFVMTSDNTITHYGKLTENTPIIDVGAGSIECLEMELYVGNPNSISPLQHYYYSNGIGAVIWQGKFVSQTYHPWERRLESYTIQ